MQIYMVVYSAFRDFMEYREYYDLVISDQGLYIVPLGRLPIAYKKHPSLPRSVERQLLEIMKARSRNTYYDPTTLALLASQRRTLFIPTENVIGITLRERDIPLPPILRKPPSDPRATPKYTERVLAITIYWKQNLQLQSLSLFTTPKLKEKIKRALKESGFYIQVPE